MPCHWETLQDYLAERDPGRWQTHPGDGFDWVLRLLETGKKDLLTPPRRGRIGKELRLADRFGIPSRWLLSFLHEVGSDARLAIIVADPEAPAWVPEVPRWEEACSQPDEPWLGRLEQHAPEARNALHDLLALPSHGQAQGGD